MQEIDKNPKQYPLHKHDITSATQMPPVQVRIVTMVKPSDGSYFTTVIKQSTKIYI